MASSCGAYGCTNRGGENKEISFHSLHSEKKKVLRSKWLQNIRRGGKLPKILVICSEHFEKCFERDLKAELWEGTPRHILKEDAVPTIFCFTKTRKKRPLSEAQAANSSKGHFIEQVYNELNRESSVQETKFQQQTSSLTMIDKGIYNSIRTTTRSTQYQRQLKELPTKKDDVLKMKISKRKT